MMTTEKRVGAKIREVSIKATDLQELADGMRRMTPAIEGWISMDPSQAIYLHVSSEAGHLQTFVFDSLEIEAHLQMEEALRLLSRDEDLHYFWENGRWVAEDESE